MKIAILHNFMDNIGGAEIVALTMARELNADIYTTNIDRKKIKKMGFSSISIKSIGKVSDNGSHRLLSTLKKFRKLNLKNKYDIYIISGEWALSGAVNNRPNLLYAHHLIKEAWDLYSVIRKEYLRLWRIKFDIQAAYLRFLTKKYIKYIDIILCNSENTLVKIKNYVDREAIVVYPPIETSQFKYVKNGNFWLSVNRLLNQKRIDMQFKAFARLPNEKLILVGSYEKSKHFKKYAEYIKKIKPDNVILKSHIKFEELANLYANCKGFITTSKNEDFGMSAVEAMASGKPVIAPNEGGYRETITDGVTGKLIDNIDENKLIEAIKDIGKNPKKYKQSCQKQAKKFDTKIFVDRIWREINNLKDIKYSFNIRKYMKGDEKELLILHNKIFNKKITMRYWNWKYQSNPLGFDILLAVNNKGKIVGQYCRQIQRMIYFGKEYLLSYAVDVGIEEAYRNKGFNSICINIFPKNVHFAFGFPEKNTMKNYLRQGIIKKSNAAFILEKNIEPRKTAETNIISIEGSSKFEKEMNELWNKKKRELEVSTIRDWPFIRWRIIKNPNKMKLFILKKKDEIIGYFSIFEKANISYITDLLVLNNHIDTPIIHEIERKCNMLKSKKINLMISDKLIKNMLLKNNYKVVEYKDIAFTDLIKRRRNINIYITYADRDLF